MFEKWLEKQLKAYFNPLVGVVVTQEITYKCYNHQKSSSNSQHLNKVFDKDDLKDELSILKQFLAIDLP